MKNEILKVLRNTTGYVSGQELCNKLGVSRTAVWKVISQLRADGYQITAVQNKGYCLQSVPDILSESELSSQIKTECIAQKIEYFDELDSTNTYAKKIAEDVPDGTLVIADEQVKGKGSKGRSWDSKKGCGIWMSLILKPQIMPQDASKLTLVAALSTARYCQEQLNIPAQIKWPNDIVCNGKKVCGILTEMSAEMNYVNHIILGIGMNVNTKSFPEEIRDTASSLCLETGNDWNRSTIVAGIMTCFEEDYKVFLKDAKLDDLIDNYKKYSVTIGRKIKVLDRNGSFEGEAIDVNANGHLVVKKEDGSIQDVFADEVSVRGVYGYV